MDASITEWLNLIARWVHVVTAIAWVGSSFFFNWLDARLVKPTQARKGIEGELWMVHSGGFYRVEKIHVAPEELPKTLHWFKWEAGFTWISGFFLLLLTYYFGSGALLADASTAPFDETMAKIILLVFLVISWIAYDFLRVSSFGQNYVAAGSLICIIVLSLIAWWFSTFLSGVAAYFHVGAIMGTCMAANVWVRIIPAQRALVAATRAGSKPDEILGRRAKQRSIDNNYMTLPVIFIMISVHFPSTWGSGWNWLILIGLALVGAGVRHWFNLRNRGYQANWIWPAVGFGMMFIYYAVNYI